MSRKLMFSAEARQELREAVSWYEERGLGLGRQLLAEARECFHRIDTQPETGGPVKGVKEAVITLVVELRTGPGGANHRGPR